MTKQADLTPPLGWMGGPCKVVERIEDSVRTPALREDLSEKVEHGEKLTNSEAAKIYSLESERGAGLFKQIRITPHAQYRMDQRAITVGDLRVFFADFGKVLNDWKSQQAWEWKHYSEAIARSEPIEWVDKRLGDLEVVFAVSRNGVADIVTTYQKGEADPRPGTCSTHPQHFHTARTVDDMSPVRTLVKDPTPSDSDTDKPQGEDGKYPTQGLPSPWSRSKPTKGPTVLNVPGESGSDSDGTIHKDKVRTKGTPGGQYDNDKTHPTPDVTDSQITPHRRPSMAAGGETDPFEGMDPVLISAAVRLAGMYPPAYPTGRTRHRKQRGRAYNYYHKRYKRQRGTILRRQKQRYKRLQNNGQFTKDRDRRKKYPDRFKTKPSGGAVSIADRNRKQRDKAKKKAFEPVPFYLYEEDVWGTVIEVSPLEAVHYEIEGVRGTTDLDTFFEEAVVDEDRLDDLLKYLDEVFDYDPSELDADEDAEEVDSRFDTWLEGRTASGVCADFLREQRPPDMADDTEYDRADNHEEWARRDRKHLEDVSEYSGDNDGEPGSKVLPGEGAGHYQKQSALIAEIREGCASSLVSSSQKLAVKLRRVDARNAMWLFDVEGSKEPYRIRLQALRQGNVKSLAKTHVRVSCSCPFWQWQGPEHWASQEDYLFGKPRGMATKPVVKDPSGQHRACKHVLAVMDFLTSRNVDLPTLRDKQGALRYLADTLEKGEVILVPEFNTRLDRVVARYLASIGGA